MRRIWILDIALFALLIAIAVRFHNEWVMFKATHQPASVEPERENFAKSQFSVPSNSAAPANWTDIPSHNPFSFDRTDIALLEPKAPPPPPAPKEPPKPKPVLFGVMSLGSGALAMVGKGAEQGKPASNTNKAMKVGDVIDGWTIASISVDDKSIVVKGYDKEETIIMNDPTAQVPRDHTRTLDTAAAGPSVISIGGQSPAAQPQRPQAPAVAPFGQDPAQPVRTRRVRRVTPFGISEVDEPIP